MTESSSVIVKNILKEVAHKLFEYNPESGVVKGKIPNKYDESLLGYFGRGGLTCFITRRGGKELATKTKNRAGNYYYCFSVGFKNIRYTIKNHQLAWLLHYGEWVKEIDHIDGNGLNNKLHNLRSVTRSENNKNHKKQSNNSSGIAGVSLRTDTGKWKVFSFISDPVRKQVQIGNFEDFFEACCARKSFELLNGYTERHGK